MADGTRTEPEAAESATQAEAAPTGQLAADAANPPPNSQSAATAPKAASPSLAKSFDFVKFVRVAWVPALLLVLLGLTIAGIIVGLTAPQNDAFGKFCIIAAVPLLSIAFGFFTNRFFHDLSAREKLRKDVQMAAYTTYHLKSSVVYVDERVGLALGHLLTGSVENALLNLVSAKTATELAFGVAQQSASQLEMISPKGATAAKDIFTANSEDARPKIIPGDEPKLGKSGVTND